MTRGLIALDAWHRVMLHRSPGYSRLCHVLAVYLTTGYWDLRGPGDHDPGY